MDSGVRLYIERAENEARLASAIFILSGSKELKEKTGARDEDTFYSGAISHAYYAIFYAAKAILLNKGIKTNSPEIHRKTFEAFRKELVDNGELDVELLKIYKAMIVRAEELLGLFGREKWKRGHFTYQTIAQANILPAKESISNAQKFIRNIMQVLEKQRGRTVKMI